ncbi:hypothetical protein H0A36_25220 [Endozoicomonas sp. SM1973]|uniref:Uncharacterized protein n=1 Tax=Spartinivicinus marinus TaxID=2994442 RepID=A0A853IJR6_9GAMM|nr:hypothetical protein [Spartinivicinus marinus]MCX4027785.1 hypothetical protein [Spartinivicinus marinus]NYZ69325.1 hypothetical protein [Spartinivicinus marinus]
MKVIKVWRAMLYRDGGSYGFCFDSEDGNWYEFFLKNRAFEKNVDCYHSPVIYFEGHNKKNAVKHLSWSEAKKFVAPLNYNNECFKRLVRIVNNAGKITE